MVDSQTESAFYALHNAHEGKVGVALGIARTNVLPLGCEATEGGLFLQASRINHSCRHNAQNTWNDNLDRLTIHALNDIKKGEEICISYLDGSEDYQSRRRNLQARFGFYCTCELCSLSPLERSQSDKRLNELTRLDKVIGNGISIVTSPTTCLYHAHRVLELLQEEHIEDARIPRLYYDAMQIAIANGDQARAKVFAKRAYAARVILEGEDSPSVARLKGLVECPSSHRLYGTTGAWRQNMSKVPETLNSSKFESWLWKRREKPLTMDALSVSCTENREITSKASGLSVNTFETSSKGVRQLSGFLRLLRELRDKIYSHLHIGGPVDVQSLQFEVDSWTRSMWEHNEQFDSFEAMEDLFPRKIGVLSVCRQMSDDALYVLYGCSQFILLIDGGAHDKFMKFGSDNIRRIGYLRIVAQPMGICYPDTIKFDSRVWIPLLTDLDRLCLVVQQPLRVGGYYNAPSLKEDMQEWMVWLESILRYLARNIAKTTIVEVDDNGLEETGKLLQKCFPASYEKVQTMTGDRIFMRREFSWESDYWDDDSGMNFSNGGMGDDRSD
ncbi:hypothetical protein N0V90_013255 [Kalmusia sp. IMI 367209]|nr:hypothetical protein N0V90_013255 [Kalmusia sp. IMI 367209]